MNVITACVSPDIRVWIRTHLAALGGYGLLIVLGVGFLTNASVNWYFWGSLLCAAFAVSGFIYEHRIIAEELDRWNLTAFGSVLAYCAYPCPGTSMLAALAKSAGVEPSAIEEIHLQTCAFSNPYLRSFSDHLRRSGVNRTVCIEIIGQGDATDCTPLTMHFPNSRLLPAKERLTVHFNVIKANSHHYLWFEPEHDDSASKSYIPKRGAFLVDLVDAPAAFRRYYGAAALEQQREAICA